MRFPVLNKRLSQQFSNWGTTASNTSPLSQSPPGCPAVLIPQPSMAVCNVHFPVRNNRLSRQFWNWGMTACNTPPLSHSPPGCPAVLIPPADPCPHLAPPLHVCVQGPCSQSPCSVVLTCSWPAVGLCAETTWHGSMPARGWSVLTEPRRRGSNTRHGGMYGDMLASKPHYCKTGLSALLIVSVTASFWMEHGGNSVLVPRRHHCRHYCIFLLAGRFFVTCISLQKVCGLWTLSRDFVPHN